MTLFSATNLSKKFDRDILFEGISFGMESGERVGLIGKNGIGKSTLLKVVAGIEEPDTGEIVFNRNITFEFLEQNPLFLSNERIIDEVMSAKSELFNVMMRYEQLCFDMGNKSDDIKSIELQKLTQNIDNLQAWNYENETKTILSSLGIEEFDKTCNNLSGGQRKRVALAKVLLSSPDLIIMDEPTNHLDADSVQWLQDQIQNTGKSILFITHDRYFLDAISTKIIEIDRKKIFSYDGSYETYLEQKANYVQAVNSTAEHIQSRLIKELAWLSKGAKARRTKQKSRIDWIKKITAESDKIEDKKIKIELGKSFLGKRVIDANYITKSIDDNLLFKDYTYNAKPGDRVGYIGPNGCGKSTLLNVLSGNLKIDSGDLKIGESVKIGFYSQELDHLDGNITLIATLREIAEFIDCGVGRDRYLTSKDLLTKFLFPPEQHNSLVSTLSGGERRRLALLKVLMLNPNVIFLDEPTNDLDIHTLNVLEDYLDDFYGVLLVVSHDRAFLDRTVHFIHSFEGNGKIKEYPGNYSFYLEKKENKDNSSAKQTKPQKQQYQKKQNDKKKKLTYTEQKELSILPNEIEELDIRRKSLNEKISSGGNLDYVYIESLCKELDEINNMIDDKTNRWIELEEKQENC